MQKGQGKTIIKISLAPFSQLKRLLLAIVTGTKDLYQTINKQSRHSIRNQRGLVGAQLIGALAVITMLTYTLHLSFSEYQTNIQKKLHAQKLIQTI